MRRLGGCDVQLRWNVLGSPGGVRLANLFYHNTALTTVDLSANRLGAEAALVIGEALKANDTLVSLDLSENPLGEDGIRHLMVMLVINRKLETLELKSCNVGKLPAEVRCSSTVRQSLLEAQIVAATGRELHCVSSRRCGTFTSVTLSGPQQQRCWPQRNTTKIASPPVSVRVWLLLMMPGVRG
jgi:hypothetical protein